MEDHTEKKRELELAQKKIKEYKDFLKGERKKRLKEKFSKLSVFIKLKPWIVWNSILTIMVLVLFIGAYTSNPNPTVNEENKVGSFLGNIFGFLSKGDKSSESNETTETSNSEDNITSSGDVEDEETETQPSTGSSTSGLSDVSITTPQEVDEINFDMWASYNEQEFSNIETGADDLVYYIIFEDKESFDIKCEGDDYKDNVKGLHSNFEVQSYDQRSIYTKVFASEAGDDNKTIMKHEFTCYDVDESIDEGTKKTITVTINFE